MRPLAMTTAVLLAAASLASATTITVDHAGSGDFEQIQLGINAASEGDTVVVLQGTYTGVNNVNLDFGGTNIVLEGKTGATWTTIDCEGADATRAFHFHSGEDTTSIVRDIVVVNGDAYQGGAAYCTGGASPIFQSCVFSANRAEDGGAIYSDSPGLIIRGCDFTGNTAGQKGGAVCADDTALRVRLSFFQDNDCEMGGVGGGIFVSHPSIDRQAVNIHLTGFTGCGVKSFGGAIYCQDASPVIARCLFWDNTAWFGGAAICCDGASPSIENCTIARSSSFGGGSGIYCGQISGATGSSPTIINTIVAFGVGMVPGVACGGPGDDPTITHCVVFGNAGGDDLCGDHHDNLITDPLFCDPDLDDFYLCEDSPCAPANNAWGELIGGLPTNCPPCDNPVEDSSWGSIKKMYR